MYLTSSEARRAERGTSISEARRAERRTHPRRYSANILSSFLVLLSSLCLIVGWAAEKNTPYGVFFS